MKGEKEGEEKVGADTKKEEEDSEEEFEAVQDTSDDEVESSQNLRSHRVPKLKKGERRSVETKRDNPAS